MNLYSTCLSMALFLLVSTGYTKANERADAIRANYTKYECRIPVRDHGAAQFCRLPGALVVRGRRLMAGGRDARS